MFTKVGSLIGTPRNREPKILTAIKVRLFAKEVIARELADLPLEITEKIQVKTFKNGVLTISATSMVAAELKMRSGGLVDAINKSVGVRVLKSIRFRVI